MRRKTIDDVMEALALATRIFHRPIIGSFADVVNRLLRTYEVEELWPREHEGRGQRPSKILSPRGARHQ